MPKMQGNDSTANLGTSISDLPYDVLLSIFTLNADMDQETETTSPALVTLLHSSQVCFQWRQIINSTSQLWASVVDFNLLVLNQGWLEDVLRRSGNSLLAVKGNNPGFHDMNATCRFFLVLNRLSSKIRHLNIEIQNESRWPIMEEAIWEIFRRPTPHLETFVLKIPRNCGTGPKRDYRFFDGSAPALRKFVAPTRIDLWTPWLFHIRELWLSGRVAVDQLLEALPSMSFLEVLNLSNAKLTTRKDIGLRSAMIHSLKSLYLSINSTPQPYLDFLTHISAPYPVKCELCLIIHTDPWDNDPAQESTKWKVSTDILCSLPRLCDLANTTMVTLLIAKGRLFLKASHPISGTSTFEFMENNGGWNDPDMVVEADLQKVVTAFIQSATFSSLHHLSILGLYVPAILTGYHHILERLSAAKILATNPTILRFLTNLPRSSTSPYIFFPQLQTLEVQSCRDFEVLAIQSFLRWRLSVGKPIQTIYAVFVEELRPDSMKLLDEFKDLEKVFKYRLVSSQNRFIDSDTLILSG